MKRTLALLCLILAVTGASIAQMSVKTEAVNNRYFQFTAAGTDTVTSGAVATPITGLVRYLHSFVFTTPVAADSIFLRVGTDTLPLIIFGATAPAPFTLPLGIHVEDTVSMVRKKGTQGMLIYRQGY